MTRHDLDARAGVPELVELDRGQCLGLLSAGGVGRVVFTTAALPAAQPVTYLLDGEEVLFRVDDAGTFRALDRVVIGFQVDGIDRAARTGWSVLGVGHTYEVLDPARLAALDGRLPQPWVPCCGGRVVAVPMQHLTGRRLGPRTVDRAACDRAAR